MSKEFYKTIAVEIPFFGRMVKKHKRHFAWPSAWSMKIRAASIKKKINRNWVYVDVEMWYYKWMYWLAQRIVRRCIKIVFLLLHFTHDISHFIGYSQTGWNFKHGPKLVLPAQFTLDSTMHESTNSRVDTPIRFSTVRSLPTALTYELRL